ncbi:MAG: alpha/beta hydrolase [Caldilineaceae bacterium]|nr:alpha/beta hydrolase [Caldilineaceae bacterium]
MSIDLRRICERIEETEDETSKMTYFRLAKENSYLMIEHNVSELSHVRLHYVEAAGPGPALLFVHGSTGSHTSFLPFMLQLERHAHVYALDLRGHGLSGRAPGAYQLPDYGRDVAAFVNKVVGGPVFVAGHSLGGLIALWLAAQHPDQVRGVFLEDPPLYMTQLPRFGTTGFYQYFKHLSDFLPQHHAQRGTLDEMVEYVSRSPINDQGQTLLEVAGAQAVAERALQLHQLDPATLDPLLAGILLGPHAPDELLAQVRCPVRLLAGQREAGGALDAQDVARAVGQLAHCEHTVFPGVGHMIHQERPDAYAQALIHFITQEGGYS